MTDQVRKKTFGGPEDFNPSAVEAERSLIARIIVDPGALEEVEDHLKILDFSSSIYQELYRALMACQSEGINIDKVNVIEELKKAKMFHKIGGINLINELIEEGKEALHVSDYMTIILEKSKRREILGAARQLSVHAIDADIHISEVVSKAEEVIFGLNNGDSENDPMKTLAESVSMALKRMQQGSSGSGLIGCSTGFKELDDITSGLQPGQLVLIAARPGIGKSALALKMAYNMAKASNETVIFYSYEMSNTELTQRLLSFETGVPLSYIKTGKIPFNMERDFAVKAQNISQVPLLINDRPPETIGGLKSSIRKHAKRSKMAGVVVDYAQLISGDYHNPNKVNEVATISRGLKLTADEIQAPVIALSQLNRNLEARPDKRPLLSDLRDSGALEQDASMVLFIYRDHFYNPSADPTVAEIILAKHRNGATGHFILDFEGETVNFKNSLRTLKDLAGVSEPGF